jgi:hypothetical protein
MDTEGPDRSARRGIATHSASGSRGGRYEAAWMRWAILFDTQRPDRTFRHAALTGRRCRGVRQKIFPHEVSKIEHFASGGQPLKVRALMSTLSAVAVIRPATNHRYDRRRNFARCSMSAPRCGHATVAATGCGWRDVVGFLRSAARFRTRCIAACRAVPATRSRLCGRTGYTRSLAPCRGYRT